MKHLFLSHDVAYVNSQNIYNVRNILEIFVIFIICKSLEGSQKVFHRLLLYISRGSNTNVCTTYDCRERDLVANVWVDQTTDAWRSLGGACFFSFALIVVLLRNQGKAWWECLEAAWSKKENVWRAQ